MAVRKIAELCESKLSAMSFDTLTKQVELAEKYVKSCADFDEHSSAKAQRDVQVFRREIQRRQFS